MTQATARVSLNMSSRLHRFDPRRVAVANAGQRRIKIWRATEGLGKEVFFCPSNMYQVDLSLFDVLLGTGGDAEVSR
jgi:hypothetical protein